MAKTSAQLDREIAAYFSKKIGPHVKTSTGCRECSRLHSMEDHERHGGDTAVVAAIRAAAGGSGKKPQRAKAKTETEVRKTKSSRGGIKKNPSRRGAGRPAASTGQKSKAQKTTPSRATSWTPQKSKAADPTSVVLEEISRVPASGRIDDRVFVSALWARINSKISMDLPEFKDWLVVQNRNPRSRIGLSRADAVGAMNPELVRRSEIQDSNGATFHFVERL